MNISLPPGYAPLPAVPPTRSPNLTPEQAACCEWITDQHGNLIIEAVAGSGKTFTIVEMLVEAVLARIAQGQKPHKIAALMAFNAKVRDELKERIKRRHLEPWVDVNTVHGFAFSAFKAKYGPRKPTSWKLTDHIKPLLAKHGLRQSDDKLISQLICLAKDSGMGILFPEDEASWSKLMDHHDIALDEDKTDLSAFLTVCSKVFHQSIADHDKIDFSDMIYIPLVENLPFPQYDFIFVDEAQDTNATRREIVKRMMKPRRESDPPDSCQACVIADHCSSHDPSRLICVGDRHQAIYGFTGADNDSLDQLKTSFNCHELPLSTCFRCSKAVIDHARKLVNHIHAKVGATQGEVLQMPEYSFRNILFNVGSTHDIQTHAVLCRKNAPLVSLAFSLVKKRIPCRIEGKDIGQQLIYLLDKVCKALPKNALKNACLAQLDNHIANQASKLSDYKLSLLRDKASAITILFQDCTNRLQFENTVNSLFSDYDPTKPPVLTLSSIHKSKGLEWPTVYLLGRNAWQPSPYASLPWMLDQETNLTYVAITRAQQTLVEVIVPEET